MWTADVQADLSLRWVHMPFCWFCHEAAHFHIYTEHQWKATNDSRSLCNGAHLVLSGQRTAVTSAFFFFFFFLRCTVLCIGTTENGICHTWMHDTSSLTITKCYRNCKVLVLPESLSFASSISWHNRNHFDDVFKEDLSGIHWHVFVFENNVFKFWKTAKSTKYTCRSCSIVPALAEQFFALDMSVVDQKHTVQINCTEFLSFPKYRNFKSGNFSLTLSINV